MRSKLSPLLKPLLNKICFYHFTLRPASPLTLSIQDVTLVIGGPCSRFCTRPFSSCSGHLTSLCPPPQSALPPTHQNPKHLVLRATERRDLALSEQVIQGTLCGGMSVSAKTGQNKEPRQQMLRSSIGCWPAGFCQHLPPPPPELG